MDDDILAQALEQAKKQRQLQQVSYGFWADPGAKTPVAFRSPGTKDKQLDPDMARHAVWIIPVNKCPELRLLKEGTHDVEFHLCPNVTVTNTTTGQPVTVAKYDREKAVLLGCVEKTQGVRRDTNEAFTYWAGRIDAGRVIKGLDPGTLVPASLFRNTGNQNPNAPIFSLKFVPKKPVLHIATKGEEEILNSALAAVTGDDAIAF